MLMTIFLYNGKVLRWVKTLCYFKVYIDINGFIIMMAIDSREVG